MPSASWAQYTFELNPGRTVDVLLFESTKNSAQLRQRLINQELNMALINAEMLASKLHFLTAAQRTVHSDTNKALFTNTIMSEMVYNLSPSTNIADSLRKFGISAETTFLLVALFDATPAEKDEVEAAVEGQIVSIERLETLRTSKKLENIFKIGQEEMLTTSLESAVVSRIALKGLL